MTVKTYKVRRRLQMQPGVWREADEMIPEAHTWWRVDSWAHTGQLAEVEVDEAEFREAIDKFCPELGDKIRELTGLGEAALQGDRKSPRIVATKRKSDQKAD